MLLKKWDELPDFMRNDAVKPYYDTLTRKRTALLFKRIFDIAVSFVLLILLLPVFLILSLAIAIDSKGGVFFRQVRITTYGKRFRIHKFRTMVRNAEQIGSQVTVDNDARVTRVGRIIRGCRLDELPQLIDVLEGNMSFVGTRPEVEKYVENYTDEMYATLLLPAGVTSLASIYYKDEAELLDGAEDADKVYVEKILPAKMYYNLKAIEKFGFGKDIKTMFMTVFAVFGKNHKDDYIV